MENKDHNLHEGFIGEAIRNASNTSNMDVPPLKSIDEINHSRLGRTPGSINVVLDAKPPISEIKNMNPFMEKLEQEQDLNSKVISAKNGNELETKINAFLQESGSIEIIKAQFSTTQAGLYYIIVYRKIAIRV